MNDWKRHLKQVFWKNNNRANSISAANTWPQDFKALANNLQAIDSSTTHKPEIKRTNKKLTEIASDAFRRKQDVLNV